MGKTWIWLGIVLALIAVPLAGHAQAEPTMDDCAEVAASAAIGLAETYVEGLIRTMVVLAATAPVQAADWDGMLSILQTFQAASLPMATWFMLPDGSYHAVDGGQASANLSDRAYFPTVMSGQIATGYFVVSRSAGKASMVTAVPVASAGQIIGALGVSLFLDSLSLVIAERLALPDGIIFYAATPDGQIALHSDPALLRADASEVGAVVDETATAVSRLLGWRFGVGPAD